MDTADTRYQNILALLNGYEHDAQFADAAGISTSYLSQIKTRTRNLGEKAARRIEINLGLDTGKLDEPGAYAGSRQDADEGRAQDDLETHQPTPTPVGPTIAPRARWRRPRRSLPPQVKEAERAKYDLIQDLIRSDMTAEQVNDIHRYFMYIAH